MSKRLDKNIIISSLGFIVLVITVIVSFILFPKFYVKDFSRRIDVNINEEFSGLPGNVCFGNTIVCYDTEVAFDNNVDTSTIGTYLVEYSYTFENKVYKLKQIVNVKDLVSPIIESEDEDFYYCALDRLIDYNVKATDNLDGDLTDKIEKDLLGEKIIFRVSDSSGNKATLEKDVKMYDKAPDISLIGEDVVNVVVNNSYNELGIMAYDKCDGDLSDKVVTLGYVDTSKTGEYKIIYTVTNSLGLSSSVTRIVKVYSLDSNIDGSGKNIYLTFDDGPSYLTDQLLDVLKKYNVKATFFVTNHGIEGGYASSVVRAFNEGHTVALHSATHDYSYVYSSIDNYFKDLYSVQSKVYELTGQTSTIVRFPGGSSNTVSKNYDGGIGIMTQLTKLLEEKGYRYFDWNVSSGDAGATTSTDQVYYNVVNNLIYSNNVVLQHDTKSFSVAAVERIINYGLSNGFTFKALREDSPNCKHGIFN